MRTQKRQLIYLIMIILTLTISACAPSDDALPGTGDNQQPGSEADLVNTRWRLVSYGEPGSEIQVIEGTEVTLQFEEGNQAGGSGGCNTFGAQYEVLDGSLAFTQIISTEIACTTDGVMEQEQQYFQALQAAGEFELTEGQLTIRYNDGQGVLNFVSQASESTATPPGAVDRLAGTHWTLVSFGEPGAENSVIEDAAPTLEFDDQGQAGGSGGCNSFGATYTVEGDMISFGQITSTLMACAGEGIGEQEGAYFQALETASRFEVAADRLTIWYAGGQAVLNFIPSGAGATATSTPLV